MLSCAAGQASEMHRAFAALLRGEHPHVATEPFVAWAAEHRLGPIAHYLAVPVAPQLAACLKRSRTMAASTEVLRATWTGPLLARLLACGVEPIVFKGLGVAHGYYPSPGLRILGDLDILVQRSDLKASIAAAESVGFRQVYCDPLAISYHLEEQYHVPMIAGTNYLELHHALYRECSRSFLRDVLAAATPMDVYGVPVRALTPADLFIVLAVHWATSDPGSLWVWLLDLLLIGRRLHATDWSRVVARAIEHGLASFIVLVLDALAVVWNVTTAPSGAVADLSRALRPPERWLRTLVPALASGQRINGDLVRGIHRLSLRPTDGHLGPFRSLLPHGGATTVELGVPSGTPWFFIHRIRHVARRFRRAAEALTRSTRNR